MYNYTKGYDILINSAFIIFVDIVISKQDQKEKDTLPRMTMLAADCLSNYSAELGSIDPVRHLHWPQ